jgi:hypothetical protein
MKVTPLLHSHLLPVHHLGPSYTVASNQPHKTAGTPNDESRQNPDLFQMKFPFSFFYSFPMDSYLIIQIPIHYYTHYHILPVTFTTTLISYPPPLSFILSCSCLVVRGHTQKHTMYVSEFLEGRICGCATFGNSHLGLCSYIHR